MTTLGAKIRSRTQRLADQHTREEKNQKIITHFGYQSVPSICLHATSISMTQAAVMTVITVVNGNSIHKCANCEHYFHINSWSLSYNASDEWWVMSDELLHKYSSPGPPSTSHSHRIIAKNLLHPLSGTRCTSYRYSATKIQNWMRIIDIEWAATQRMFTILSLFTLSLWQGCAMYISCMPWVGAFMCNHRMCAAYNNLF